MITAKSMCFIWASVFWASVSQTENSDNEIVHGYDHVKWSHGWRAHRVLKACVCVCGVHTLTIVCVCAHMCMQVCSSVLCMYMCVEAGRQQWVLSSGTPSVSFMTGSVIGLSNEAQISYTQRPWDPSFFFPSTAFTSMCHHTWHFYMGSELRPLCLRGQCFTKWVILPLRK